MPQQGRYALVIPIEATDEYSDILKKAQTDVQNAMQEMNASMEGVQDEMGETGKAAESLGVKLKQWISDPMNAIGTAATVAGGALYGLTKSTREYSQALGRAAVVSGISRDALEQMARATGNVTMPAQEVAKGFEYLAQVGVKDADVMAKMVTNADRLATATGTDLVEALKVIRAESAVAGVAFEDMGGHMNAIGAMAMRGSDALRAYRLYVTQLHQEMKATNITSEDMAVATIAIIRSGGELSRLMPRLVAEMRQMETQGINGEAALQRLATFLGITREEFEDLRQEVGRGAQSLDDLAKVNAEHLGAWDRFLKEIQEIKLNLGFVLQPLDDVGQALMQVGAAILVVNVAMKTLGFTSMIGGFKALWSMIVSATTALWGMVAATNALKWAMVGTGIGALLVAGGTAAGWYMGKREQQRQNELYGSLVEAKPVQVNVRIDQADLRDEEQVNQFGEAVGAAAVRASYGAR